MDHGYGLSLLPVQGSTREGYCESCTMVRTSADGDDDDVVLVSRPELPGVLVVSPWHVRTLEELSISHRANLLAAVQRATRSVTEKGPGPAPRIVALTDLTASEGHLCVHVMPGDSGDSRGGAGRE